WKREQKLFDQLPEFIVSRANEIPAEIQSRHLAQTFRRKTRLFDTHPSDAERVQRAIEANEPGIIHSTAPAMGLFADFPEFSRRFTRAHYQRLIGPAFSPAWLVSTEQAVHQADHDPTTDRQAVQRYFFGLATSLRPIVVAENKSLV